MTSSMYFSGSTIHATASTRGSRTSTRSRCSRAIESKSGRSSTATSASAPPACSRSSLMPSHCNKPASSRPRLEETHATASDVVGRRAPAGLTFSPAIAFNNVDFPTPVPPTSARTYALLGKPSRARAVSRVATAALASRPTVFAAAIASSRFSRQRSTLMAPCRRPPRAARPQGLAGVPAQARAPRIACAHLRRSMSGGPRAGRALWR